MKSSGIASIALSLASLASASPRPQAEEAGCQLPSLPNLNTFNQLNLTVGEVAEEPSLCLPQGEGAFTFARTQLITAIISPSEIGIFDNTCTLLGAFDPDAATCDNPIIQAPFLQFVVTNLETDLGFFSFQYGDGQFSIGNNGCTCGDIGGRDEASGCKCAFPVNGISS